MSLGPHRLAESIGQLFAFLHLRFLAFSPLPDPLSHTDLEGTDHNQYVYVLRCNRCGQEYGANGSDIWLRKCPYCQGGAEGLPLE